MRITIISVLFLASSCSWFVGNDDFADEPPVHAHAAKSNHLGLEGCPINTRVNTLCTHGHGPYVGIDDHHRRCSDQEPPNVFPGQATSVEARDWAPRIFDAVDANAAVWTINTDKWSDRSALYKGAALARHAAAARVDKTIADACGLAFVLGIADEGLARRLQGKLRGTQIDIRHLPACTRK